MTLPPEDFTILLAIVSLLHFEADRDRIEELSSRLKTDFAIGVKDALLKQGNPSEEQQQAAASLLA